MKDSIRPLVVLTILAAVILIPANATGVAWVRTAGGMIVPAVGMFWGRTLRAKRMRESLGGEQGDQARNQGRP
ncbi:hypothetical protein [Streptomyces sp. MW-W600-10]|uniref:hypothetical protein n=1 Tax=Streptomyces sp. MW-W600-10 TaxID=2829819 RepID=UPI001C457C5C|nr:hypothetical protein [Streptomyces sp. MW-W600-10]MBV7248520.1 hypothetical protein [Streptomyces sp. MW-W600-10]